MTALARAQPEECAVILFTTWARTSPGNSFVTPETDCGMFETGALEADGGVPDARRFVITGGGYHQVVCAVNFRDSAAGVAHVDDWRTSWAGMFWDPPGRDSNNPDAITQALTSPFSFLSFLDEFAIRVEQTLCRPCPSVSQSLAPA